MTPITSGIERRPLNVRITRYQWDVLLADDSIITGSTFTKWGARREVKQVLASRIGLDW